MARANAKEGKGCLFQGCLVGVVLLAVLLVAVLLGAGFAKRKLKALTDTAPAPLPKVQMPPEQVDKVVLRMRRFQQEIHQRRSTPPLVLTAEEIDAVLASDQAFEQARDKVYVTAIEGGLIKAQLSLPLTQTGFRFFRGRYFNGMADLELSLTNGNLRLVAKDITVKGKPLPRWIMSRIAGRNFAQDLNANSRGAVALDQLHSIKVEDGKLVIVPNDFK
jgi:hypothetical protein